MSYLDNIRRVTPYVPGEQPKAANVIKLNTNENPYPPAEGVKTALSELNCELLRRYPDPNVTLLVRELAEYYGVAENQVFVGVGSDDVLAMSFLTFFSGAKPVLFPDITYSFYDVWAEMLRIPYRQLPLDENFRIRREDYRTENGGIVIANPNAPTAIGEGLDFVEDIVKNNPDSVVLVDEAYVDFGGVTALPLVGKYPNVAVVRTFSKSRSMAGMRIGFLISSPELVGYLNDVKQSFNSYTMNATAIVCGVEAVRDRAYFEECCEKIVKTREWAGAELRKLGFHMTDSRTNFLFVTHEEMPAGEIFLALRERNIFVRYFKKPRIDNYLRITVGTDHEMLELIRALKEILKR